MVQLRYELAVEEPMRETSMRVSITWGLGLAGQKIRLWS